MAKKIDGYIKLQIPAGGATPAPPVGPALGQKSVNIMDFCKQFNARTADQSGMVIPVVITVYADRSFSFVCKTPPAAVLLKNALEGAYTCAVYSCNGNIVLLGLLINAVYHLVGTGACENNHQIGRAKLVFKVGRHLCENLCLAVI